VLFYNHKQEFIGIDEEGLKLLNYPSIEDLLSVCNDVADLFAKEPGYIHNFKSFGWIDFLLHADSDARSAIVHGNGRTFSCTLHVHSLFLAENPSQNGYIIEMTHIQSLSGEEIKPHHIAENLKQEVKPAPIQTPSYTESSPSILPSYEHIIPTTLSEPDVLDVPAFNESGLNDEPLDNLYANLTSPLSDEELHYEFTPEASLPIKEPAPVQEIQPEPKVDLPMLGDVKYSNAEKAFINTLKVDKSYRFDPNVAAKELGLPVDLIQEFIGDFIQQSHEFKEELFEAVLKGDINNLKILSHKLKGVAANLRIEDAFETLSIINTSSDPVEIEANLKYFYSIINKLEGKELLLSNTQLIEEITPSIPANDDLYAFSPKDAEEPLFPEEKSSTSALNTSLRDDDIYSFALKDNDSLIVHEEELSPTINLDEDLTSTSFDNQPTFSNTVSEPMQPLNYNKTVVAGELGIEQSFFNELVEEYKHDAMRAAKEISASISAFDTHAWKKTASQLKGISDNLRLSEISEELAILSQTNDAQEANKASKRLNNFLEQL
jgi:HPt (histidine-containing phosphotransfer) domain-containing protein